MIGEPQDRLRRALRAVQAEFERELRAQLPVEIKEERHWLQASLEAAAAVVREAPASVADEKNPLQGKLESVARVDGVEQVQGVPVALDGHVSTARLVAVGSLHGEHEESGIHEQ
jgi:hypothetical protein